MILHDDFEFDLKILVIIAIIAIVFEMYVMWVPFDGSTLQIVDILFLMGSAITAVLSFVFYIKTPENQIYKKPFLILGIASTMFFIGDFMWIVVYDVILNIDPYPSVADLFYFAFYPLMIWFIVSNTFLKSEQSATKTSLAIISISIAIPVYAYITLAIEVIGELNFDFYYGLIFIFSGAATTGIALAGARYMKLSHMGKIWLIITAGIMLNGAAGVWYYYLETFAGYTPLHTVDVMWSISWILISYGIVRQFR